MSGEKVTTGVGGRVVEVNFHEGDEVKEGEVLIRLDTERLDNDIARLERQSQAAREEVGKLQRMTVSLDEEKAVALAKARAELAEADEAVRVEQERWRTEEQRLDAEERLARIEEERGRAELERTRQLLRLEVVPRVDVERAEGTLRDSQARLERARVRPTQAPIRLARGRIETASRSLDLVAKQFDSRRSELELRLAGRRGELDAGEKTLANLRLEREQHVIRAHVGGIVTQGEVRVGDVLDGGKPALAIAQQKGFRVDAAIAAADIAEVKVGMKAQVKLSAFDYQKHGALEATVVEVPPDSQVKEDGPAVYVVRMRLEREDLAGGGRVKLGMMGQAEVLGGQERLLWILLRRLREKVDVD